MKKLLILLAATITMISTVALAEKSQEERKAAWKECTEQASEQKIAKAEKGEWIKSCWRDKVFAKAKK